MHESSSPGLVVSERRIILDSWNFVCEYKVENTSSGCHCVREVVHRPDISVVLPFSECRGTVTLIAQDRVAAHLAGHARPLIEAASGRIDVGETPEQAGLRELREETGLVVSELQPRGCIFLHPALSVERAHLFTCDLDRCLLGHDEAQNDDMFGSSKLLEIQLSTMADWCEDGLLIDAKTVLLLQRLQISLPYLF